MTTRTHGNAIEMTEKERHVAKALALRRCHPDSLTFKHVVAQLENARAAISAIEYYESLEGPPT